MCSADNGISARRWRRRRYTAVIIALPIILALLYSAWIARATSVQFSRVARLAHDDAMAAIRERSKTVTSPVIDNQPVQAVTTGLQPGEGVALNPRFVNIGETQATVYRGSGDEWFILGKVEVLDYVDGQWRVNCIAENQRLTYRPPEPVR